MAERVVVTGAQGFLGRHLVARLLDDPRTDAVVGLGRSPSTATTFTGTVHAGDRPVPAPLPEALRDRLADPRYGYRRADVADEGALTAVLTAVEPTVVVHAAAALRDEPWDRLAAANIAGVATLVAAAARCPGPPRFVLVSSGSVYGATARLGEPLAEPADCLPLDLYGVSKLAAEHLARVLTARAGMRLAVGRVFNIVGPGLDERHLPAFVAARLAGIASGRLPPELRLGPLGATRDFLDVRDAAAAVHLLATGSPDGPSCVNVASGVETRVGTVVELLVALARQRAGLPEIRRLPAPARAGDVPRAVADVSRLAALGHRPAHPLADSLAGLLDYYLLDVAAAGAGG